MAKNSTGKTLLLVALVAVAIFAPEIGIPAIGAMTFL